MDNTNGNEKALALEALATLDTQIQAIAAKNPDRSALPGIVIRLALLILRAITALLEAFKPDNDP